MRDLPPINFVCIDEAHCITTLSHNFRPCYLKLVDLINARFGMNKTLLALTGTATIAT
jgi:superfamily II DNA helicase RecQ